MNNLNRNPKVNNESKSLKLEIEKKQECINTLVETQYQGLKVTVLPYELEDTLTVCFKNPLNIVPTPRLTEMKLLPEISSTVQMDQISPAIDSVHFNCKVTRTKLEHLISEWQKKVPLVAKTCYDKLIDIIMSEGVKPGSDRIDLVCTPNEFRCIILELQKYFKFLNFMNIERSQVFYDSNGNPFKADTIYQLVKTKKQVTQEKFIKGIMKKF
jgi:hypothetical protein